MALEGNKDVQEVIYTNTFNTTFDITNHISRIQEFLLHATATIHRM